MDIPGTFWVLVGVMTALSLFQIQYAVIHREPVLALIALTFLVYFGFGGLTIAEQMQDYRPFFFIAPDTLVRAGVYGVVVMLLVWLGYSIPQRTPRKASRAVRPPPAAALLFVSALGLAATVVFFIASGGISAMWSRAHVRTTSIPWQATLRTLMDLTLVFPLFVYRSPAQASQLHRRLAVGIVALYALSASVGGSASYVVNNAVAFGLLWLRRTRPSFGRILLFLSGGAFLLSGLRFLRYMGSLRPGERDLIQGAADFLDASHRLNLLHSFDEFYMFAKMLEVVDTHGLQYGGSYLVAFSAFIPGAFFPGKVDFMYQNRADTYLPRMLGASGYYMWPVGFYGEAYQNFGLLGLLVISLLIGWLLGRAALWLRSPTTVFGLPSWLVGCYLGAAIAASVRMEVGVIVFSVGLRVLVLNALLVPFTMLSLRPRGERVPKHDARVIRSRVLPHSEPDWARTDNWPR